MLWAYQIRLPWIREQWGILILVRKRALAVHTIVLQNQQRVKEHGQDTQAKFDEIAGDGRPVAAYCRVEHKFYH